MIKPRGLIGVVAASFVLCSACEQSPQPVTEKAPEEPVVVYFAGEDDAHLRSVLDGYSEVSGVPVVVRRGSTKVIVDDLIADVVSPPADVLVSASVTGVARAAEEGALRPLFSQSIKDRTPAWLRDPDDLWFGLSYRSAIIVFGTSAADTAEISSYAILAEAGLNGRLCLSSSKNAINRSVIAMLIESMGVRSAEIVVRGWLANLALPVFETEDQLVDALRAGECQVGIASSTAIAKANSADSGATLRFSTPVPAYADIEGVGVARHARKPIGAVALVEWLFRTDVQSELAMATMAYPAVDGERGSQETGAKNVGLVAWHEKDAAQLAERARYP